MKVNHWKLAAIILACLMSAQLGYQLNFWLNPARARAQNDDNSPLGRFVKVQMHTGSDVLLDTATGRAFDFYGGTGYLNQIPIKACVDADCATRKPAVDAR